MRRDTILFAVGCAILLAGFSSPGFGSIFLRRRISKPTARLGQSHGWQHVLQSDVRINDSYGSLNVLGYNNHPASAMRQVRRSFYDDGQLVESVYNETMGRALIQTETEVSRIIALDMGRQVGSVVFVLTQTHDDYTRSFSPPKGRIMPGVPDYPGKSIQTFVHVKETNAQMEISTAKATPVAVQAFYQSAMKSNGWQEMTPRTGLDGHQPLITLYQKGFELCAIMAKSSGSESVITVLHKRLKM